MYDRFEERPTCEIALPHEIFVTLVNRQVDDLRHGRKADPFEENKAHSRLARTFDAIGKKACGSACAIECGLHIQPARHLFFEEQREAVEISCRKKRCKGVGVLAVSSHVLELIRPKKIAPRKIRKAAKRR